MARRKPGSAAYHSAETVLVTEHEPYGPSPQRKFRKLWLAVAAALIVLVVFHRAAIMLCFGIIPGTPDAAQKLADEARESAAQGSVLSSFVLALPGTLESSTQAIGSAAVAGQTRAISILCMWGCELNQAVRLPGAGPDAMTPLGFALRNGQWETADWLVQHGARLAATRAGNGPALAAFALLEDAAFRKLIDFLAHHDTVRAALEQGDELAARRLTSLQGPLMPALQSLQEMGFDGLGSSAPETGHFNLLHLAVEHGDHALFDWLMKRNYPRNLPDEQGRLALQIALLKAGATEPERGWLEFVARLADTASLEHLMQDAKLHLMLDRRMTSTPEILSALHRGHVSYDFSQASAAFGELSGINMILLFDEMNDLEVKSALHGDVLVLAASVGTLDALQRAARVGVDLEREAPRGDSDPCVLVYAAVGGSRDSSARRADSWRTAAWLLRRKTDLYPGQICSPELLDNAALKGGRSVEDMARLRLGERPAAVNRR